MPNDRLPAIRPGQQLVRKEDAEGEVEGEIEGEVEGDFIEIENRKASQSSQSSAVGQIVKAVVYSALEWLDNRRTSNRSLINRADGEAYPSARLKNGRQSSLRIIGKRRSPQTSVEDEGSFRLGTRRRIQCCGSGNRRNRRIRRKRKK